MKTVQIKFNNGLSDHSYKLVSKGIDIRNEILTIWYEDGSDQSRVEIVTSIIKSIKIK
jgi:hypothetical protein